MKNIILQFQRFYCKLPLQIMICGFFLLFITSSCYKDYFANNRPAEPPYKTTITLEQGVSNAYLITQWSDRGYMQFFDYATSGTAKILAPNNGPTFQSDYYYRRYTVNINDLDEWGICYRAIGMCNSVIDLDKKGNHNPFNLSTTGADYTDNYSRQVSECYFLRAFNYYRLMRIFAQPYDPNGINSTLSVMLDTTLALTNEQIAARKRGTVKQVYGQIISDLLRAESTLPLKFSQNSSWNTGAGYACGRANKYVARAFLARINFMMGNYAEAKKWADLIITDAEANGTFAFERPESPFIQIAAAMVPKESIYEFNSGYLAGVQENQNQLLYRGMYLSFRHRECNGQYLEPNGKFNPNLTRLLDFNVFGLSHDIARQIGWMDPNSLAETSTARSDLRYRQNYHRLEGFNPAYPKLTASDSLCLVYELATRSKITEPQIYIDKFFRGEGDATTKTGRFSKVPYIRLAEMYLIRAAANHKIGSDGPAALDLNKIWNRAHLGNAGQQDSYPSQMAVTDLNILNEFIRELSGEGGVVDFIYGLRLPLPKTEDDPTSTPILPPYSQCHFAIPSAEVALNPLFQQ